MTESIDLSIMNLELVNKISSYFQLTVNPFPYLIA